MNKMQCFEYCENKAIEMWDLANDFVKNKMVDEYKNKKIYREEFGANSRYMPRGFYCPSVTLDKVVDNVRRGKLLSRITPKSKISHRFAFDEDNKLIIVETMPPFPRSLEYIVYEQEKVLGFTIDEFNKISGLSEEIYEDGQLISYFYVAVDYLGNFDSSVLERYWYKDNQLHEVDHLYVLLDRKALRLIGCDAIVRYTKLSAEDGDF